VQSAKAASYVAYVLRPETLWAIFSAIGGKKSRAFIVQHSFQWPTGNGTTQASATFWLALNVADCRPDEVVMDA
jgi:hypothetical protein